MQAWERQGGRLWYKKLAATLVSMGFKILRSDSSVYVLSNGDVTVIIPVFVDDCTNPGMTHWAAVKHLM